MALPSIYFDAETAIRESPEVTRKDLTKTLQVTHDPAFAQMLQLTAQQFTLALNVSEAFLFLHRPYFARALHERKPDPTQTGYGQSYLCVVERCNVSKISLHFAASCRSAVHRFGEIADRQKVMIQICASIYPLHPAVIARHWYFWVGHAIRLY